MSNWAQVSIFCVATIIFQHCLNLLGMEFTRASQVATGVPLPLLHDNITELVDVRDPTDGSIGFRSGDMLASPSPYPQLLRKAVVVLEVRLGSLSCWNTALRPSLRRAFMVPSMNCSSPVLAALMQPQTMTLPPPCLTVGKTHLSLYSSPGCRHTRLTPSEPNKFILVIHVLSLLVFSKLFAGFLVHHL